MSDRFSEEVSLLFSIESRLFALRLRQHLIDRAHLYGEYKTNIVSMSSVAILRRQIEADLADRIPSALTPAPKTMRMVEATGI